MSKRTLKNRCFSKRLKIKQNTEKNEADFQMNFRSEKKLVPRSGQSQSLLCPFKTTAQSRMIKEFDLKYFRLESEVH